MGDRRQHRRFSLRVRESIGRRPVRPRRENEFTRLLKSGDYSAETMDRIAELLGQHGPKWPPGNERNC